MSNNPVIPLVPGSPVHALLLLGPTGVGKSPLGDVISQKGLLGRRCHHLDFGAELRGAVSCRERSAAFSPSELGFIHCVLERGLLLENEHFRLAEKIISLFLGRTGFSQRDLLVLNGIPRHEGQARDITAITTVHALIVLDCSADEVLCRIRENIGGDRTDRIDDAVDLIGKKLMIFRERTAPLIDYYDKQGASIYRIHVTSSMTPGQTYERLSILAAAHPPVSLVAEPPQR